VGQPVSLLTANEDLFRSTAKAMHLFMVRP